MDEHTRPALGIYDGGSYLSLLDHLLEGCQLIGFDWRYLYLNNAALRQNRNRTRDELLRMTMLEAYPGLEQTPVFAVLRRCMEERVAGRTDIAFDFPDGSTGWFEVRCEPVQEGIFILSIDITERKRAQDELIAAETRLRQAQKMEAIGRLAAGVAHDFNNLLTVISLASDILLPQADEDAQRNLLPIREAAARGAALTRQLLAFSRQQVLAPRMLDLNAIVSTTEQMLGRLLGADIAVTMKLTPDLALVKADPGQIEQVIMNLAINARDAMPEGGTLTLETANVTLDGGYVDKHPDIKPGTYVMLAVSDTGIGMDKDTQTKIFEPFFTTKSQSKGTGLGLATVFGIVRQSGGGVWVYSEPGHGTCFKVYLPRATEEDVAKTAAPPDKRPPPTGSETILLVEDDAQVRVMTALVLELAGYTVLATDRGREALDLCRTHAGPIHLLISDVIMPDMGGRKVSDAVRALRPDIRVLYVSGYTDDAVLRYGIELGEAGFLQKPFTPDTLAEKVREVLAGSPSG